MKIPENQGLHLYILYPVSGTPSLTQVCLPDYNFVVCIRLTSGYFNHWLPLIFNLTTERHASCMNQGDQTKAAAAGDTDTLSETIYIHYDESKLAKSLASFK